jgi:hypothetical protein
MVRKALPDIFKVIHFPVSGTKKRFLKRFGKNLRLVFLFEWETRFPEIGRFPVNSQTLDMMN